MRIPITVLLSTKVPDDNPNVEQILFIRRAWSIPPRLLVKLINCLPYYCVLCKTRLEDSEKAAK